jgi:hypothetical protein
VLSSLCASTAACCSLLSAVRDQGRRLENYFFLDTQALLPLLYFTLEQAMANQTLLEVEMKSLKCLLQIHLELSRLKRQKCNLDTEVLNALQQEHQQLYSEAYGDDRMKPKHHMRMHLPEQMKKSDLYIDCLPMEKNIRLTKVTRLPAGMTLFAEDRGMKKVSTICSVCNAAFINMWTMCETCNLALR